PNTGTPKDPLPRARAAPPRVPLAHPLRLTLFVGGNPDAPPADFYWHGYHRMRRFGEWWMIIVGRHRFWLSQIGHIDDAEAAMPTARPHFIGETKRMMQAMAPARPGGLFSTCGMLPRHPPARDFLWLFRIT